MSDLAFRKILTANDSGESGGHQAGIHIPKGKKELLSFLPTLNSSIKNPDAWLICIDESGYKWKFRFIHYNNKLHDLNGTRDEYRITHMTKYFRSVGAKKGDMFIISGNTQAHEYTIKTMVTRPSSDKSSISSPIKLRGWSRIH